MIQPFEQHLKEGRARRTSPDPEMAGNLIRMAQARLDAAKGIPITHASIIIVFDAAYDAARQAAQALMLVEGYKPYGHDAAISYLKTHHVVDFSEQIVYDFDRFRKLRNEAEYEGRPVGKEATLALLVLAAAVIKKTAALLKKSTR